jgi:hypothetical protein
MFFKLLEIIKVKEIILDAKYAGNVGYSFAKGKRRVNLS